MKYINKIKAESHLRELQALLTEFCKTGEDLLVDTIESELVEIALIAGVRATRDIPEKGYCNCYEELLDAVVRTLETLGSLDLEHARGRLSSAERDNEADVAVRGLAKEAVRFLAEEAWPRKQ